MAETREVISKAFRVERDCPLAGVLAEKLSQAKHELTTQWLDGDCDAARPGLWRDAASELDELLEIYVERQKGAEKESERILSKS